jgi:hypothetical protein
MGRISAICMLRLVLRRLEYGPAAVEQASAA